MKVAIVCGSPTSEFLAPFDNKDYEIWVLGNRLDRYLDKRVSKVFEIHDDLSEHKNPQKYCEWLVSQNIPLVVSDKFPLLGSSDLIEPYPYKEVKKLSQFGTLASSPAYMLAYAILLGAEEVAIYGVDMAVDDHEYFWQRPCMWGWIRFAEAKGIKITIPKESALCKMNYIEGRDWKGGKKTNGYNPLAKEPFTQQAFEEMASLHKSKIDILYQEIREREKLIQTHDGCRQSYERLAKVARAVESGQSNISLLTTSTIK